MAATGDRNLQDIVQKAITQGASDIHICYGQPVCCRVDGIIVPMAEEMVDEEFLQTLLKDITTSADRDRLFSERELDLSITVVRRRLRVNAYIAGGQVAFALRIIPAKIPTLEEILAPMALKKLISARQGLILVTGSTGTGKTTTLASFLDTINRERAAHIITLEDPVEYILTPQLSFISQREFGRDFLSFAAALRGAVRAMPDVLLVGEIRDYATAQAALSAAEAGILVLGTLHTGRAIEAASRLESMFPAAERAAARGLLAAVLTGVFAQRLMPAKNGGRLAVSEVLLATPAVRNLIRQGKGEQLTSVMMSGQNQGMQTFETAIKRLYEQGLITRDTLERYE